jgi:phosphoribosyl 1,2-cyclic phosphodiesterase
MCIINNLGSLFGKIKERSDKMNELKFLGIGSAFNTELRNTSAFLKKDNSLLLIDCGGTVFHRLQELSLLAGIENLYIVITHTHPDHVGSLGDIIFYSYYILKRKANIFFPNKELIERFLESIGVTTEMYNINNFTVIGFNDPKLGEITMEFFPGSHVDTIPSYGFIMNQNTRSFYYSGDSNKLSDEILGKLKDERIHRIYQDTCGLDYEGNSHLSLKKLCELVPKMLRNKVYSIHLDEHITEEEIKDNGFCVAEIYK